MRILKSLAVFVCMLAQPLGVAAQSTSSAQGPVGSTRSSDASSVRTRLLAAVPPALYQKWRKYGEWDYKQVGFEYREFTQFNFGATGEAANINKDSLLALARAFTPGEADIQSLVDPDLESNFKKNGDAFEKLLKMSQRDGRLTRIAADFTWLDNNTKWPREDIGLSGARWDEYRSLFKSLSLAEGVVRTADFPGAIFFVAHANGLCTGGSSIGYVYSTSGLTPTSTSPTETLDAEARKNPDRHFAYVFTPLKQNWYTFYEVDW